jgi:hypothetical protein
MTFSTKTHSIMTHGITILSMTTHNIMAFSIMKLSTTAHRMQKMTQSI